jgi:hypothetical protein
VPYPNVYVLTSAASMTSLTTGGTSTPVNPPIVSVLTLEPSYVFKQAHALGAELTVLSADSAMVPDPNGTDWSFYVTDTAAATQFAQQIINNIAALGIPRFEIIIIYPDKEGFGNSNYGTDASTPPLSDVVRIWDTSTV